MTANAGSRRPPPVVWLAGGILVALVVACGALAFLAWQEAQQVDRLGVEVQALQAERQLVTGRLAELQATAEAVAGRLKALEARDPAEQLAALEAEIAAYHDQSGEAAGDTGQEADWAAALEAIQATLAQVTARLDALEAAPEGGEAGSLPAEIRLQVPRLAQNHSLSCESSATAMVAQFHGMALTEAEVLAALPLNDNPHLGFRGNVDGPTGGIEDYGVYAGPILDYLETRGFVARLVEGGVPGVRAAIARGHPVIAWVTYNCLPSTPTLATIDGQAVTLVPNQHVVVVTGYNAEGFWANDPWDGQEDFYPVADLARAMGYFGDMAIEISAP